MMKQHPPKLLRILMVIPQLQSGGAERQLGYLSRGLTALGHEIIVATLQVKKDAPPRWYQDLQLHWLGRKSNYDPRLIIDLCRLIRRAKPDIIQTCNPQTDILGGISAILTACRWVIREPSCVASYRLGWKSKFRSHMGAKADAIVSNSAGGGEYWHTLYPAKPNYIISNSLPLQEITRTLPLDRNELGIEDDQKLVLFAGRLRRQKGVERIITAVSMLDQQVNMVVLICGEGEKQDELKALVRRLGIEDRVRFLGLLQAETIWSMMKSADLFISLSDHEGMPNTVMEAISCHCPLLVSDIPAHREFLNEKSAFIVDSGDEAAVTHAIRFLLSNRGKARELARVAAKVTSDWSINAMVRNYEILYRSVISNRGLNAKQLKSEELRIVDGLMKFDNVDQNS